MEKDLQRQERDREKLDKLKKEIIGIVDQSVCSDEYTCKYIGLGSKPCGGFWEYITYSTSINENDLIAKINEYNEKEDQYNIKYGINSDCSFVMPPDDVICDEGKCVPVYN
jgi:hypothetical protein